MNTQLKSNKKILRDYMRQYYTDANLIDLLDSARGGFLAYNTCCCFIGMPTRNHAGFGTHQRRLGAHSATEVKYRNPAAAQAEIAFLHLWHYCEIPPTAYGRDRDLAIDAVRQRRIIPMILAELKRRRTLETQPVPTSCWDCSERIEDGVHDCPLKGVIL